MNENNFCFFFDSKLKTFGFWTLGLTKQGIWKRHLWLWEIVILNNPFFYRPIRT